MDEPEVKNSLLQINSLDVQKKLSQTNFSRNDSKDAVNVEFDVTDVVPVRPPDGGWGWLIVIGSFLVMFLIDGICLSYGLFLNALEGSFENVPKLQMMFAGSLITGCYLIMGPIASALSNQYGFRAVVLTGSIISSVSLFISAFMYDITAFVLIYGFGGGIGFSLIFIPGSTIIAVWFEKYRATATGIAICGSGCGAAAFSVLIPYLIDLYSWRGCLVILAALNCNCLVAGILFKPLKAPTPKIKIIPSQSNAMSNQDIEKMITDIAKQTVENERSGDKKNKDKQTNHLFDIVMQNKERDRAKSTGSLNNMIITSDNKLVADSVNINTDQIINAQVIRNIIKNYLQKQEEKRVSTFRSHFNLFLQRDSKSNSIIFSQTSIIASQPQLVSGSNIFKSAISLRTTGDRGIVVSQSMARKLSEKVSEELSRPILKPDLYYPGSTQHLNNENIQFHTSQYLYQSQIIESTNKNVSPTREALKKLFDISILKSWPVQINIVANFVGMFGFLIPFQFLISHAMLYDHEERKSAALYTILGLCSCFGRIVTGAIADFKWANCLIIHNVCLVIAGVDTMLLPLMTTYPTLVVFVVVYAFSTAAFISLKTIVIVDVMGTSKLTNIFGWTTLAMGLAIIFGPPLLGSFYDFLQSYNYTFILGGGLLALSGIISAPLRIVARLEAKKRGEIFASQPSLEYHMSPNADVEMTVK